MDALHAGTLLRGAVRERLGTSSGVCLFTDVYSNALRPLVAALACEMLDDRSAVAVLALTLDTPPRIWQSLVPGCIVVDGFSAGYEPRGLAVSCASFVDADELLERAEAAARAVRTTGRVVLILNSFDAWAQRTGEDEACLRAVRRLCHRSAFLAIWLA